MTGLRAVFFEKVVGHIPIRLVLPLLLGIFVFLIVNWEYVSNRRKVEAGIERESHRDLNLDMTRLQASLEEAARTGNTTWMQDQFAAFGADTYAVMALLANEQGQILASANRSHLNKHVDKVLPELLKNSSFYLSSNLAATRTAQTGEVAIINDGDLVASRFPVLLGAAEGELRPNRIGVALVARDLAMLKSQALTGVRLEAVQIALVLIAAGVITSMLLHLLVTRRLARIARAADRLATGDLTVQSGVGGRDEIALLGKSFDSMVTDLQQHEAALVESEERHRSLFLHAVEGIVTMGEDRLIQSVNPAAQKMFGYTEDELVGKNVKVLMPAPYHGEHDGYVQNYVETGKKEIIGIGREVFGKRKSGLTFPLELSVVELKLTNERLFTGILRDITDRRQAEDELQRVNENLEELVRARTKALEDAQESLVKKERLATLGQLAGSVAHEVRNPLGIVRTAAYFLEQTAEKPDADAKASYEEIRRGLARADHIITELLEYARDPQSSQEEFLLADAINRALEGVSVPIGVVIDIPVPSLTPQCRGDLAQTSQIINNLIVNAIQAMPEGGTVNVQCTAEDRIAIVEVSDSGTGMTERQLSKIFEPLFTTKTRGIGLGLTLSQRFAEQNQGSLTAKSTLGEGSTFRLTMPIASS